jgi:enolase-phosphatase E1
VQFILTDIEGTTTSVSFVYEVLFPYFRAHCLSFIGRREQATALLPHLEAVRRHGGLEIAATDEAVGQTLVQWSLEDSKHPALKAVQGLVWEVAYREGSIRGHVFPEVPEVLKGWHRSGMGLGVYSSGSVAAQRLLFRFSEYGDLTSYFSHYFDTGIGGKKEEASYTKIADVLQIAPAAILFLSDVAGELEAAKSAGFQVLQLLRPGTLGNPDFLGLPDFNAVKSWVEVESNS